MILLIYPFLLSQFYLNKGRAKANSCFQIVLSTSACKCSVINLQLIIMQITAGDTKHLQINCNPRLNHVVIFYQMHRHTDNINLNLPNWFHLEMHSANW